MKACVRAGAKINLALDITGKRSDGYHCIKSVMQSVSLYDLITVEAAKCGITVNSDDVTLGGLNDITFKAAKLFFEKSGIKKGAVINIKKSIPVSAGLGGGSTDAAAVLLALNKIFGNPLSFNKLRESALDLGADVPFFLTGGTSYVTGIGEICEALPNCPDCFFVIAKNSEKQSTAEMYRKIDLSHNLPVINVEAAKQAVLNGDLNLLCNSIGNVFSVAWEHNIITDILNSAGAKSVSLSGSGPSYFGAFDNLKSANTALNSLKNRGITAFSVKPTASAVIFE